MKTGIAVKAFIVNEEEQVLIVQRQANDEHAPSLWELPGGRLEPGENPYVGLKREIKEETSLQIRIKNPLKVHHFTRNDKTVITMISFWCTPTTKRVKLSDEHADFAWVSLKDAKIKLMDKFQEEVGIFEEWFGQKK